MTIRVADTSARRAFEVQAGHCDRMGAPFTARLCLALADRLDDTSALGRRVLEWPRDNRVGDLVPLRCCAGFHRLAREKRVPALVAVYPPQSADDRALRNALQDAIAQEDTFLAGYLDSAPQTNEVGRSAILLGGLLNLAARVQRPLALHEIGASAGINMSYQRWHYRLGDVGTWGAPDAPVVIDCPWTGDAPALATSLNIVSRRASDIAPLDPSRTADRERLLSYIWAEQTERLARTTAALEVAAADDLRVEKADARKWLRDTLAADSAIDATCTVLFHSVFIQYLDPTLRAALVGDIRSRGEAATRQRPFAWLRMEASATDPARCELRLSLWPSGEDCHLADVDWHGRHAHWT